MTAGLAAAELEALEWEPSIAGGQAALIVFVFLSCVGAAALVTYVIEEVRHDPSRHPDDEEP
jgi:hypothetical protein